MSEQKRTLPEYEDPPVIETFMGFDFLPIQQWAVTHYGLFWSKIRSDYPTVEVQPLSPPVFEQFGESRQPGPIFLPIGVGSARCWFIDETKSRLVQVQHDRFLLNWRRMSDTAAYPRYDAIRPIFLKEWNRFIDFLKESEIPVPQVRQWEISYVNQLERGKGWENFSELSNVVRCWSCDELGGLPPPEGIAISSRYLLPGGQARLAVDLQPATRLDGVELIQLSLTAKGQSSSQGKEALMANLDLGHEWIVRGFDSITSDRMHKLWGKKGAS